MLVATFGPTTGWVGKTITCEGDVFTLEGYGPISAADVMSYDSQGQLEWASEGMRAWVGSLAHRPADAPPAQPSDASRSTAPGATPWATSSGPRSRTTAQRLLLPIVGIVGVVLVVLILAVAGVFSGEKEIPNAVPEAQASPSAPARSLSRNTHPPGL